MTDCMITRIRKEKRLTQEQFASFCGVSKSLISSMEQGNRVGKRAQLLILAGATKLLADGTDAAITKSTDST